MSNIAQTTVIFLAITYAVGFTISLAINIVIPATCKAATALWRIFRS